jgi:hypothetical protein
MLDGLRDFGQFLRAIWQSWIGVMAGGIGLVLTVLGLWTPLPGKQLFIGGGVVAIIYSAFTAWRTERAARPAEEPFKEILRDDVEAQLTNLDDLEREWLLYCLVKNYLYKHSLTESIAAKTTLVEPSAVGHASSIIGWNHSYSRTLSAWAADQVKKGIKPDSAKMAALHAPTPGPLKARQR